MAFWYCPSKVSFPNPVATQPLVTNSELLSGLLGRHIVSMWLQIDIKEQLKKIYNKSLNDIEIVKAVTVV